MSLMVRRILVVLGILILAGGFALNARLSGMKEATPRVEIKKEVKEVVGMNVKNGAIPSTIPIQGELVAFDKIDIFSEVNGTLLSTAKPFKVGSYFSKGTTLIKIDQEETQLSLLAQKSTLLNAITQLMPDLKIDYPESFTQWKYYLESFDLEGPIQPFPKALNKQEKYFIASRNLLSQYYNIKSLEERLSKYEIMAPFSGVVTQTSINPGALVRSGQKLGELMNTGNYELEVTLPLRDLSYIKVGAKVTLTSDDIEGKWTGRVKRINDQLDPGTQMVKVFISVSGRNLREGMYLSGAVQAGTIETAFELPRPLLVGEDGVYIVEENKLRLKTVELVKLTEDFAIVKGLPDGTTLLKDKLPDAFDGMTVSLKTS